MSSRPYLRYWPALLVGILGIVIFRDLIAGEALFFRDYYRYFFPARMQAQQLVAAHGYGAWNPLLDGGLPLLADLSHVSLLYPPSLLLLPVDSITALSILVVAHFFLAAAGAYRMAKHYCGSTTGALVGSLAFSMGGLFLSSVDRPVFFNTLAWAPWVLWAWMLVAEEGAARLWHRRVGLALLIAVQFLAGEVQLLILTQVLGAALFVGRSPRPRALISTGGFVAGLAIALVAVQLLPTFELSMHSTRGAGIPIERLTVNSLHPWQLTGFVLPYPWPLFPSEPAFAGYRLLFGRATLPLFAGLHTGVLVFALGIGAVLRRFGRRFAHHSKERPILVGLFLFFSLLALGKYLPTFFGIAHHLVPFGGSFLFPIKYLFVCHLILCLWASRGVADLCGDHAGDAGDDSSDDEQVARVRRHYGLVLAAVAVLTALAWLALWAAIPPTDSELGGQLASALAAQGFTSLGLLGLGAVVVQLVGRPWLAVHRQRALVLLLVCGELLSYASRLIWTAPRELYEPPAFAAELAPPDRDLSLLPSFRFLTLANDGASGGPSNSGRRPFLENAVGIAGLAARRRFSLSVLTENTGAAFGIASPTKYGPLRLQSSYRFWTTSRLSLQDRYRLYGTRLYHLGRSAPPAWLDRDGLELVTELPTGLLLKDPRAKPIAWLTDRWLVADAGTNVAGDVAAGVASLDDPVPVTGLEESAAVVAPGPLVASVGPPQPIDGGYRLDVQTDRDALLVIADNAYPGWTARVDGIEVPIGVAYGVFKALRIAPGEHRVELAYRSVPLLIGAGVSAITVILLLLWALRNREQRQ